MLYLIRPWPRSWPILALARKAHQVNDGTGWCADLEPRSDCAHRGDSRLRGIWMSGTLALAWFSLVAFPAESARPHRNAVAGGEVQNQFGEEDPNPGGFGEPLGAGTWNCRRWLSSPASQREGSSWILVWWSATNDNSAKNQFVGVSWARTASSRRLGYLQSRPANGADQCRCTQLLRT
jgi:hypothetical protein